MLKFFSGGIMKLFKILVGSFILTSPIIATAATQFELAQRRLEDRLPLVNHAGKDIQGKKCTVSIEYVKPAPRDFLGLTIPTAEFIIVDSESKVTQLTGSYITSAGRGGCMTIGTDTPNQFEVVQLSSVRAPCYASASRLGPTGILRVTRQNFGLLLFEIFTLDNQLQGHCAVSDENILIN